MPITIISTIDKRILSSNNDINSILEGQIVCINKSINTIYRKNLPPKTYINKPIPTIYVVESL
jgi:hypothetical protein